MVGASGTTLPSERNLPVVPSREATMTLFDISKLVLFLLAPLLLLLSSSSRLELLFVDCLVG